MTLHDIHMTSHDAHVTYHNMFKFSVFDSQFSGIQSLNTLCTGRIHTSNTYIQEQLPPPSSPFLRRYTASEVMRTKPTLCCPTPAGVLTRINWVGEKGERSRERGRERWRKTGEGEVKGKWKGKEEGRGGEGKERRERRIKKIFSRHVR